MKTRKRLARRVTEVDTIVIDSVARKVFAVESVGYGEDPKRTTIHASGGIYHFWWDDKVDVVVR